MHPHTSYLICATHRTGSTLLCEALTNTGIAGRPDEYFWPDYELKWAERWGSGTYNEYLASVLERTTTPNGVFGAKIMWAYFNDFLNKAQNRPGYPNLSGSMLLGKIFPNLHYIWIGRRDKVRQAVSLWKAVQTQVWAQYTDESATPARNPVFDFAAIEYWFHDILRHENAWQQYFAECGVIPFTVVYEDFVAAYQNTVLDTLRFLGIFISADLKFGEPRLRKQADAHTEECVQRYHQLKRQIA